MRTTSNRKKRSKQTRTAPPSIRVYLAGPISKNGWRNKIVPDIATVLANERGLQMAFDTTVELPTITEGLVSNGPFFVNCDHGCAHGRTNHGVGASGAGCFENLFTMPPETRRSRVFEVSEERVRRADVIFAYFDRDSAYGTCVEIGIARAFGKFIFVGFAPDLSSRDDYWFAAQMASCAESSFVGCVEDAWSAFVALT